MGVQAMIGKLAARKSFKTVLERRSASNQSEAWNENGGEGD